MAAVTWLLVLVGCVAAEPAYRCCDALHGRDLHGVPSDEPPTDRQVEVVRHAITRGVLDGSFDTRRVAGAMARNAREPVFWSVLRSKRHGYRTVLETARALGGADVLVAGAWVASRLNEDYPSKDCRDGPWQLPLHTEGVGACELRDGTPWELHSGDVPRDADAFCVVSRCREDPRRDLVASTKLALSKVPRGASQREAIEALELGDPAVAAAVHLLAICALPDLFDASQRGHCAEVQVPEGR